jgi:hypothetical protein
MKISPKLNSSIVIMFFGFGMVLSTSAFAQQQPRLNFVAGIKGKVEILRPQGTKPQTAFFGALLDTDDKLRVPRGASGEIACDNGTTWILSPGEFRVSQGCKYTDRSIFRRKGSLTSPTRSDNKNANIPYLISPRNTVIMTSTPTLRWNPIPGATSYKVRVLGGNIDWETQVNQPMVIYAGEQLQPNISYQVVISTSGGITTKNIDEPKFVVLEKSQSSQIKSEKSRRDQIRADVENLQRQAFNNQAKSLALAHLYRSNDLNEMAIDELERAIKNGSKITAIYQLLGEIYQQIDLNSLAKTKYETGLILAQKEGNLEAQESIQVGLAEVSKALD